MKRGEVWTVSGGGPYGGKPRPAVIVQEDRFDSTNSITLCVFTTDPTEAPLLRMLIEPTDRNGLSSGSRLMVDKVTTVPKARLGKRIGKLNDEDVVRLNRALTVLAGVNYFFRRRQLFLPVLSLHHWSTIAQSDARSVRSSGSEISARLRL